MLIPLIPASFDNFTRMRLIFLFCSVVEESNIVVNIEIKQGARLSPGLVDDKVIESIMLVVYKQKKPRQAGSWTYVGYHQVLLV